MDSFARSRPSPAMIVAVVALSFAIVGTAIAGPDALTSAITKSKVKKIAKKQIKKLAPGLSVANAENAVNAQNAETVNGARIVRVFHQVPSGGAAQDVFTLGGVKVTLGCVGADPQAIAVSQVDNSAILVRNTSGTFGGADIDAGGFLSLSSSTFSDLVSFEFVTPAGGGATASLRIAQAPSLGSDNCLISGSVIAS